MIQPSSRRRGPRSPDPRGTILIATLVCLVVVAGVVAGMVRSAVAGRRQLRFERDALQAELLLQAGLERASIRGADPDYQGESWRLTGEEIVGAGEGLVTLAPEQVGDRRIVVVQVEYPLGGETSIRRSRSIVVSAQPN